MADTGIELDRTPSGKIKVNVVSVANLAAIVGLLITAIGTWNGLVSRVDNAIFRVDVLSKDVVQIRTDMQASLGARDGDFRELRAKVETSNTRLTVLESQLNALSKSVEQVGKNVNELVLR